MTLAYKDTKMLVPAVSLYPRFTVHAKYLQLHFSLRFGDVSKVDSQYTHPAKFQ
jgi:hypothetical protein